MAYRELSEQDAVAMFPRQMSGVEAEELSSLLGTVYDAAIDPALWPLALQQACRFLNCAAGVLIGTDLLGNFNLDVHWGYAASFWERYRSHYFHLDPLNASAFRTGVGGVVLGHELDDWRRLDGTAYYREWVEPQGFVDLVSGTLDKWASGIAVLTCVRHKDAGLADSESAGKMRLILPHFSRAVQIAKLLEMKDTRVGAFVDATDALSVSVFFVDADGTLLHANGAGREMLAAEEPVLLVHGMLTAADPAAHRALRQSLATVGTFHQTTAALAVPGKPGTHFDAQVLPLTTSARRQVGVDGSAVAAVFLRETVLDIPLSIQAAGKLYGFTPAEERVLRAVIEVGGLSQIAEQLGVARRTVQTHLEHLFQKTGSKRQAELVKLIAGHQSPLRSREQLRKCP